MATPSKTGVKSAYWALITATFALMGTCWDLGVIFGTSVNAQDRAGSVTINAPTLIQIQQNKNVPLPIKISSEGSLPKQSIVLIRGLPSSIALTVGRAFESGVWGVKPSELSKLRVNSLGGTGLTSKLSVSVVTLDGAVLAENSIKLVVASLEQDTTQAIESKQKRVEINFLNGNNSAPEVTKQVAKQVTKQDKARIEMLMQRGNEYFKIGSVIVARGFYNKAAELGSGEAMVALARTFDPTELSQASLPIAVKPDIEQARKWYEKAKQQGSTKAVEYLGRLP